MQRSLSYIVMPSGVLDTAFGETGQTATQGASVQWLHSTGITTCTAFGKVPSVFMRKSAQLKLWPSTRLRGLFSALQANAQAPHPTHPPWGCVFPRLWLLFLPTVVRAVLA